MDSEQRAFAEQTNFDVISDYLKELCHEIQPN